MLPARIQKMRDDGKDPYDIRKQEEVLQESYMMVPDSKARLETAIEGMCGVQYVAYLFWFHFFGAC